MHWNSLTICLASSISNSLPRGLICRFGDPGVVGCERIAAADIEEVLSGATAGLFCTALVKREAAKGRFVFAEIARASIPEIFFVYCQVEALDAE